MYSINQSHCDWIVRWQDIRMVEVSGRLFVVYYIGNMLMTLTEPLPSQTEVTSSDLNSSVTLPTPFID